MSQTLENSLEISHDVRTRNRSTCRPDSGNNILYIVQFDPLQALVALITGGTRGLDMSPSINKDDQVTRLMLAPEKQSVISSQCYIVACGTSYTSGPTPAASASSFNVSISALAYGMPDMSFSSLRRISNSPGK